MDQPYKAHITNMMEDSCWNGVFKKPLSGAREYPLLLTSSVCYADFCYELSSSGKLFIEDDDATRGLNNLVKYCRWCLLNLDQQSNHLIHIIGADNGACLEHCKFIKVRREMELVTNGIKYHIMTIDKNWHTPDMWLANLKEALTRITATL